jgi:hypothetical protein
VLHGTCLQSVDFFFHQYVQPCLSTNPKYTFYTIKCSLTLAYYFGQDEDEMKLCLMILSVPWYMLNELEHTAILNNFLTFITGSSSRVSTF